MESKFFYKTLNFQNTFYIIFKIFASHFIAYKTAYLNQILELSLNSAGL